MKYLLHMREQELEFHFHFKPLKYREYTVDQSVELLNRGFLCVGENETRVISPVLSHQ